MTPDEKRRAARQAAADATGQKRARRTTDDPDEPPDITPDLYADKPTTTLLDDIRWVWGNLRNLNHLRHHPGDAPSAMAMNLLLEADADRKTWMQETLRALVKHAENDKSQERIRRWTQGLSDTITEKLTELARATVFDDELIDAAEEPAAEPDLAADADPGGGTRPAVPEGSVDPVPE